MEKSQTTCSSKKKKSVKLMGFPPAKVTQQRSPPSCRKSPALVSLPRSVTAGGSHGNCGPVSRMVYFRKIMLPPQKSERCFSVATIPAEEGLQNLPLGSAHSQVIRCRWCSEYP